jgi:hypothetical protein
LLEGLQPGNGAERSAKMRSLLVQCIRRKKENSDPQDGASFEGRRKETNRCSLDTAAATGGRRIRDEGQHAFRNRRNYLGLDGHRRRIRWRASGAARVLLSTRHGRGVDRQEQNWRNPRLRSWAARVIIRSLAPGSLRGRHLERPERARHAQPAKRSQHHRRDGPLNHSTPSMTVPDDSVCDQNHRGSYSGA